MQHTSGATVVTMPLAQIDRRALSEAWYRSMHLAVAAPRTPAARVSASPARAEGRGLPVRGIPAGADASRPVVAPPTQTSRERGMPAAPERRLAPTPLGRRIERAVVQGAHRPQHGACTIREGRGRVIVLVRHDGARARIVAVCAPSLRARVERALAHARFALAAHRVRSEVA
jgi:hypothetical protein